MIVFPCTSGKRYSITFEYPDILGYVDLHLPDNTDATLFTNNLGEDSKWYLYLRFTGQPQMVHAKCVHQRFWRRLILRKQIEVLETGSLTA